MSKKSNYVLLQDILEAINHINSFTKDMNYEEFSNDAKTEMAVLHALTIMGEASNKLSTDFVLDYNDYDWRIIVAFRNRIVHDYAGVDYNLVWQIITKHLAELKEYIEEILNKNNIEQL